MGDDDTPPEADAADQRDRVLLEVLDERPHDRSEEWLSELADRWALASRHLANVVASAACPAPIW